MNQNTRIMKILVSMPHAALLVVQGLVLLVLTITTSSFNAARGFVGGARWCAHGAVLGR